jgi:hypothetical protein
MRCQENSWLCPCFRPVVVDNVLYIYLTPLILIPNSKTVLNLTSYTIHKMNLFGLKGFTKQS